MSLFPQLYIGLLTGLKSNTLTKWASDGATTLFDADFTTPSTSWSTGRTGFSSAYATSQWLMQSHTAGAYVDEESVDTLDDDGGGGLLDQTAVGIWDGSSYTARDAWEATANTHSLLCSDSSVGDSDNADFSFRMVFRTLDGTIASNDYLIAKFGGGAGWYVFANGGAVKFRIDSNVQVDANGGGSSDTDLADGAWHYITGWYDYSADMLYFKSDVFAEVSTSTAALTDSLTNAGVLQINGVNGAATSNGLETLQLAYVGVCVGANSQAMYDETFWNHATDPTGLLTTATRASAISVPVAAGYVGHFSDDQLPIGYHSAFSHTSKLGLYCNSATTNLCVASEDFSGWTGATITVTSDNGDAPDGFRSADLLTATAAGAPKYRDVAVSANTQYTASCWVKRSGGSDVAGRIMIRDLDAGITTTQTFSATSEWTRVTVTHTHGATATLGDRIYIQVDNNTEALLAWGYQLETGDGATAYIRTNGASASLAASVYDATGLAMTELNFARYGEVKSVVVRPQTVPSYVYNISPSGSANNRRLLWMNTAGSRPRIYDGATSSEDYPTLTILNPDTEGVFRHVWDQSAAGDYTGGYEQVLVINGTTENGAASPWEGTTGAGLDPDEIQFGRFSSNYGNTFIATVTCYDGLSEALP